MLRKSYVASLAVVGVASLTVISGALADGYAYEPVGKGFAPPPVYSWTGFYVGGHVGHSYPGLGGLFDSDDTDTFARGLGVLDPHKSFGGAQIGYNYQMGQFVFGAEGDYSWLSNSDSVTFDDFIDDTARAEIDYLASIRARFGWARQNFLLYGTVGWGWSEYEFSVLGDGGQSRRFGKISFDEDGVVYGGGLEVGLSKAITVRAEYLHYDVGTRRAFTNASIPDACNPSDEICVGDFVKFDDIAVVRAALNVKLY